MTLRMRDGARTVALESPIGANRRPRTGRGSKSLPEMSYPTRVCKCKVRVTHIEKTWHPESAVGQC